MMEKRLRLTAMIIFLAISSGPVIAAGGTGSALPAPPPDTDGPWWSRVQVRIQASEYEITWQDQTVLSRLDSAWHAPNRSHNLRTYFTDDGIRIVRRTESAPTWELGLSLVGYGRRETVSPVGKATLSPLGNRIDYDRTEIVEWYVNDPRGLEQGFTLAGPPEESLSRGDIGRSPVGARGRSAGATDREGHAPAFLVLALEGSVSPLISADGRAIDFSAPGGTRVLRYAELKVTDARGRELAAWLEGFAEAGVRGLRIVFDDEDAAYPVTVDPLLTGAAWTAESNQVGARLGFSVSTAGDVNGDGYGDVIVGAYLYDNGQPDEGQTHVYQGSPSGLNSTAAWTAESDQAGAGFGSSVSTAGDVNDDGYADVIVGADDHDNGETDEGRVYVYHGSATGLSTTADWTAESDEGSGHFGDSVSTAGDVNGDGYSDVIIGAPGWRNPQADEGRAYVYHGSAGGLGLTPAWTVESDQRNALLGSSVSTAGDVNGDGYADVIVGAYGYENGEANEGQARAYYGSASGLSDTADWTVERNDPDAQFGFAVSTAGDVNGDGYADILVGANTYDGGETDEGRVYLYPGSVTGLSPQPDWAVESNQSLARLGESVSTAGDVNGDGYADIIVGAPLHDNVETDEGRVYLYLGSAGGPGPTADWVAESDQSNATFGRAVSTAGDVNGDGYADVLVGADAYDGGETEEGRAYAYHGSASGLSDVAGWTAESDQYLACLGASVSAAGDVNGDGYGDVIVGAYWYDNGEGNEGRAYVYHGSASGLSSVPDWTAEGNQSGIHFGWSVSTAGDVNGDGYADVVIGALFYVGEGRAYVYHGSPSGLNTTADWITENDQAQDGFGASVSTAGDVNGDGYADVIVGAVLYDNGETDEGRAYVYHGSAAGLSLMADWTAESNQTDARFGNAVATAGDVNLDGYDDVIVGAHWYDNGQTNEGRAYVYHGSAAGLSPAAVWTTECDQSIALCGYSVATAGDVNGDGYADAMVGAYNYVNPDTGEGRVFVYHGSSAGLSTAPDWTTQGDQPNARFGYSVSSAGDVNGDGHADVIIGAETYENPDVGEGRAYLYHGSAAGLSTTADWTAEGDQAGAAFGYSVSTAGDVNGDGYADVIVGAPYYDNGDSYEGRAFLYYGNDGPGLALRPQQRRADDLAPIAPGGRSRESGSFRLAAFGRSPFGRGRVWPEWEIKPLGQPFDGHGTVQSVGSDSGTTGTAFNELITGLDPGSHHWRARLRYDPVTTPLQGGSRWFTAPWNGWEERDVTVSPYLGGLVWEDRDGDGIMQPEEPRSYGMLVHLLDDTGLLLQTTMTWGDGSYRFDVGSGGPLRIRFEAPVGWIFTSPDQGVDDLLDSDADTVTGETALITPPFDPLDEERWSAGVQRVGICWPPDEAVYIYNVTLTTDGNDYPVLHFQDPNQLRAVTGYNVYRSSDAGLPYEQWSLKADDIIDMDESEPNKQWVDTSGDVSPSGIWYFQVAPYNHECPEQTAEGPW